MEIFNERKRSKKIPEIQEAKNTSEGKKRVKIEETTASKFSPTHQQLTKEKKLISNIIDKCDFYEKIYGKTASCRQQYGFMGHLIYKCDKLEFLKTLRNQLQNIKNSPKGTFESDWTPMMLAAKYNLPNLMEALIRNGDEVEADSHQGLPPLLIAVENANYECVKKLKELGAKIDPVMKNGRTPLFKAVELDLHDIVRLLIKLGANRNHKDLAGSTPFTVAFENNHLMMIKELGIHEQGSNVAAQKSVATVLPHRSLPSDSQDDSIKGPSPQDKIYQSDPDRNAEANQKLEEIMGRDIYNKFAVQLNAILYRDCAYRGYGSWIITHHVDAILKWYNTGSNKDKVAEFINGEFKATKKAEKLQQFIEMFVEQKDQAFIQALCEGKDLYPLMQLMKENSQGSVLALLTQCSEIPLSQNFYEKWKSSNPMFCTLS